MPKITFVNHKKEVECEAGATLRTVALANGVPIHAGFTQIETAVMQYVNCRGNNLCGTCLVYIKKGMENTNKPSAFENARLFLSPMTIGHEDESRLSCQTVVNGDVEVETQPKANLFGTKFWAEGNVREKTSH